MKPNLKQMLPELAPAQWKLLERTILDCLPECEDGCSHKVLHNSHNVEWWTGYNQARTDCITAITNVFNGDEE